MNLKGRDFLKLLDFSAEEISYLIDKAAEYKAKKKAGILHDEFKGKNIALIFEKTSTRTRCSFEVAAHDLGIGTTYLDPSGSQIGKKESIADTARVLSGIYDGIEYRGFGQEIDDLLGDTRLGMVVYGLAEITVDSDLNRGLLKDLAHRRHIFGLAPFHMSLGERTVSARLVSDHQNISFVVFVTA